MDYNRIFKKITHNESVYYSEVGNKIFRQKRIEFLLFFLVFLFVNLFASFFIKRKKRTGHLGISWNPLHLKKIKAVVPLINILDISNNNLLSFSNNLTPGGFNLINVIRQAFRLKNYTKSSFNYSSFIYKIYIIILLDALKSHTENLEEVFVSGHFDRLTTIISEVCLVNDIKLNIIQHGCIQNFDKKLIKNRIHGNIYYSYDFSKPFFKVFLDYDDSVSFIKINISQKYKFFTFVPSSKKIITFGCQDAVPSNNFEIIDFLIVNFKNYLIHIIPHPREKVNLYKRKYALNDNVNISYKKPSNTILFISRFSTLGIEYQKAGVRTIFINLDKVKMDFIIESKHEVYTNLHDFENKFKE